MSLLVVYILTVIVGQSVSITVGLLVDRYYSSYVGLMVFIACYFIVFWLAWRFSVRITEPRKSPPEG
jgi:fucose permease